ncbi:unnamed protein product [Mytilus edulis]|uniref:Uncharacterized protein n=1 Tax=Mytilus edulis TaxID=6550 RepID=A0A8S3TJU4_MYTED|nr:unnamed protein product [Mytilus edulis]
MNEDDEEEPHAPTAFQCPYDINTFINDSDADDKLRIIETQLKVLLEKHYSKLQELFSKYPTKPADFNQTFRNITCDKNRISSKLFMWTVNQKITDMAKEVEDRQQQLFDLKPENEATANSAGLKDDTAEVDDQDENTDEIFTGLLVDMFEMIVEYFIKVAMSNAIKRFKASIPKTKKQALRAKVQALGDRPSKRKIEPVSDDITQPSVFNCPVCNTSISENPDKFDEQSIGCDFVTTGTTINVFH